jgi:hypothetical protein
MFRTDEGQGLRIPRQGFQNLCGGLQFLREQWARLEKFAIGRYSGPGWVLAEARNLLLS